MLAVQVWNSIHRTTHPFAERLAKSRYIRDKYPDRLPIIVDTTGTLPKLDKHKFLVPCDLTVSQLMYVVRKRMSLRPEVAMFMYVGTVMLQGGATITEVYHEAKDEDGFLYLLAAGENTFG